MSAPAAILSTTTPPRVPPRIADRPVCSICADSMVAAEASALLPEGMISYLWTCDNCGYGFVTKFAPKSFICN